MRRTKKRGRTLPSRLRKLSSVQHTRRSTPKRDKFRKEFYKNVLVTGGLGFIGSHVAEAFAAHQHEVTVIDNCQSNAVTEAIWEKNGFIEVFPVSVQEFLDAKEPPVFDIVCHLAAPVGPVGVLAYAGDMTRAIVDDTVGLRDYCIQVGALFVNVSTSEVYGHAGDLAENAEKVFPGEYQVRTEYGAAKMAAEIAVANKARVDERLTYHTIRPFNVAGARQQPEGGFVLPRFINQALKNEPITVYGDGTQRRGFTDARDVAEGIYRIAMNKDYINETWNIGNPDNIMPIVELAGLVAHFVLGNKKGWHIDTVDPAVLHGELFSEVPEKVPNIEKLIGNLYWKPVIPAAQMVKHAVDYWKQELRIA